MLTVDQILDLAEANHIRATCYWEDKSTGHRLPKRTGITLNFTSRLPEVWRTLMSDVSEIPVTIFGTRQSTGSGATDNMLYPEYAALLKEVNAKRAEVGLEPVRT